MYSYYISNVISEIWCSVCTGGAALHRWEEVTAAGLLLLAAAKTFKQQRNRDLLSAETAETEETQELCRPQEHPAQSSAVLVYGACDGLLASFLAQHAPEAMEIQYMEDTKRKQET